MPAKSSMPAQASSSFTLRSSIGDPHWWAKSCAVLRPRVRLDERARRTNRRLAAADAVYQVRLSELPSVRRSDRGRRGRHQSMSPGRRRRSSQTRGAARPRSEAPQSAQRGRAAAPRRDHRRGALHRLHSVHPGLPGGRDRRRIQAHAYGRDRTVLRMRPVRRALPRGLHSHGARDGRRCDLGHGPGARSPRALRAQMHATGARAGRAHRAARRARAQSEIGSGRGEKARDHPGRDRTRAGAKAANVNPQKRRKIFERLRSANPHPTSELAHRTPFELLVSVVLSAQATDKSVNLATEKLYRVADTPQAVLALGMEGLIGHIRTIGLYRSKAKHILETSRLLVERHGGEGPESREALEALPGVGRKTPHMILNTAFGQPTIAVDTHIFRVANRTGLAPGKDVREVEERLLKFVPEEFRKDTHHWLILHGRYVCKARKPECPACIIRELCEFRKKTKA